MKVQRSYFSSQYIVVNYFKDKTKLCTQHGESKDVAYVQNILHDDNQSIAYQRCLLSQEIILMNFSVISGLR